MSSSVYVAMSADIIHTWHLNIIREGVKLGDVTGGGKEQRIERI